jgi:hypothetical protein
VGIRLGRLAGRLGGRLAGRLFVEGSLRRKEDFF